ncbi:unnamed protein product [Cunninghamella blakesleeana]
MVTYDFDHSELTEFINQAMQETDGLTTNVNSELPWDKTFEIFDNQEIMYPIDGQIPWQNNTPIDQNTNNDPINANFMYWLNEDFDYKKFTEFQIQNNLKKFVNLCIQEIGVKWQKQSLLDDNVIPAILEKVHQELKRPRTKMQRGAYYMGRRKIINEIFKNIEYKEFMTVIINKINHGGRSYNADIKYNLKYLIILTDINIEEITSEYRKIMAKYWSFYSNNWPIIPESKYHRSQIKEIVDINIIKSFLLERLGVIPVYFFLVVVFGRQDYAAPYNNVEKGLLLLYHLMQGYSIAEMARFMPKTTFYNLYKEFYIKQCDELHRLLDNCLIHMFSNVKVRILCANNNNPVKFKNVTLMIDGHDNRACYTKGHNYAKTFSYKLKKSGFRTQACIDINGMVLFLSNSVHCGENNDGSMLSSIDLNNVVSPYDVVALDGGYTQYITSIIDNNKHLTKKNFMKPIRKQRNVDLPVPDMAFNKEFGSFRSMIENTFGEIGSIFKRFNNSTVIRVSDINIFSLQFKLACVLINIKRFVKLGGLPHEEHHAYWLQHGFDYNGFVDRPMEEHTSLETILEDMNDMNDMQQKFLSMNMSSPEPVNLYEVEKILNHRVTENGPEYLVKWTGYDEVDSTWETLSAFNGTQCIDEYHAMND